MSLAYKIVKDLAPLARHFSSTDYDIAISYLKKILPFNEYVFTEEDYHNGWVIPPKYDVIHAHIKKDNQIIYDGTNNPLSVVSYSLPFKGEVDLSTLRKHLWYDHRNETAIPFHFRFSYRPWERDWGFCVPKIFYDSLTDGIYEVDLEIHESQPELKVIDYYIQGKDNLEFIFVAHLDHPGMANDDIAGCAVGIEFFKKISQIKNKFSYRLILVQEIIGSQYYLNKYYNLNMREGLFLEMLGIDVPLSVQMSLNGDTFLEKALNEVFFELKMNASLSGFRELTGNDEIVFETFGIPMASLQRFPYDEYHSSHDNITIINKNALEEAIDVLLRVHNKLESKIYIKKNFEGVLCLSHPNIDLYIDPGQLAFEMPTNDLSLRRLMDYMSLINSGDFLESICKKVDIEPDLALEYLRKWEKKGLIEII